MKRRQDTPYEAFVNEVAQMVQQSREHAIRSVQRTANLMYWEIGKLIISRQEQYGWGKAIVDKLSADLQERIGVGQSWSPRNLRMMRQLYEEYSVYINEPNVKQAVSHLEISATKKSLSNKKSPNVKQAVSHLKIINAKQITSNSKSTNVKQAVSHLENLKDFIAEVPWGQNILILQKVKDIKARLFYLAATLKNGWSRAVLLHQIKADAYNHFLISPKKNNFNVVLPRHLHEQAQESIKSVYSLDFLDINAPVSERELENKLIENVKRFLLELGYGFCFIGNQYRLTLGKKEYFIDLLFYHRILKCIVAVDLKVVEFEPEFVGKLDYYLQLVDEQLKQDDDNPSIGILLVPDKDHLEVEYALKVASKPIGVAEYKVTKELPKNIKGNLPTKAEWAQILRL
jgi:predicted nuclease of restriction endonuclease-like (RecB) superfamily